MAALDRAGYDTNSSYSSFFARPGGTGRARQHHERTSGGDRDRAGRADVSHLAVPDKIRLNVGLRLPGIRTKEFFRANVIGICLAAAHIGYITIFYIISRKLGAWAPQDLNYENVVSTALPWIYPLAIAIYAATSEEFLFRLFAIPYLQRMTKSGDFWRWLFPPYAWGFLHSNYPQEPAYIRGIEVGLIGIVAGLVMLRWGIWATLTWHYTVDAFLISTSLLRSHGAYLRLSGAIVGGGAVILLVIATIFYLSRGGFETDASLLNSTRPLGGLPASVAEEALPGTAEETASEVASQSAAEEMSSGYKAMSSRALTTLVVCGVLGIALLAGVKREAIGDFVRFQIDANQAVAQGNEALRDLKVDSATYQHAATVTYTFDGYTNEYLRRTIGIAAANRVYRDEVPSAFWTIRYFRDSQNEEYMVVLRPDGSPHSVHHTLDEKTPGANLSKEEALARAEAYVSEQKKIGLSAWQLVETGQYRAQAATAARTDHEFEWEQNAASSRSGIGRARRAHSHAIARAGRRSFRLSRVHQNSRGVARRGNPHQCGATCADVRQGHCDRCGSHHRAGHLFAELEPPGPRAGSLAQDRAMVALDAAGWGRDLCKSDTAAYGELRDHHAAGDVLRDTCDLTAIYCVDLSGGRGSLAGSFVVFPGAKLRPRAHSRVGRKGSATRVLPRRPLRGDLRLRGGHGTQSAARIVRAMAAAPPHIG